MPTQATPDYLFIDAILLAYRLGHVRQDPVKTALLAATRAASDAITFLTAAENFGISRRSELHRFLGEYLAAPAHFRALYPGALGLRREGQPAAALLGNQRALFLVEPVLTAKQQQLFYDAFWWFVHNYEPSFLDPKRGHCIGAYATEPRDNASVLANFNNYLSRLTDHSSQRTRERYESFPADIVMAILERAFL